MVERTGRRDQRKENTKKKTRKISKGRKKNQNPLARDLRRIQMVKMGKRGMTKGRCSVPIVKNMVTMLMSVGSRKGRQVEITVKKPMLPRSMSLILIQFC